MAQRVFYNIKTSGIAPLVFCLFDKRPFNITCESAYALGFDGRKICGAHLTVVRAIVKHRILNGADYESVKSLVLFGIKLAAEAFICYGTVQKL